MLSRLVFRKEQVSRWETNHKPGPPGQNGTYDYAVTIAKSKILVRNNFEDF